MRWLSLRRRSTAPQASADEPSVGGGGDSGSSRHLEILGQRIPELSKDDSESDWSWIELEGEQHGGPNVAGTAPGDTLSFASTHSSLHQSSSTSSFNSASTKFTTSSSYSKKPATLFRRQCSLRSGPVFSSSPLPSPPPLPNMSQGIYNIKSDSSAPPLVAVKVGIALDAQGRRVLSNRRRLSTNPTESFVPTPVRRVKNAHGVGDEDEEEILRHLPERNFGLDIDVGANWASVGAAPPFLPPSGSPFIPPHSYSALSTSARVLPLRAHRRRATEGVKVTLSSHTQHHAGNLVSRRRSLPIYNTDPLISVEEVLYGAPATWSARAVGRRLLEMDRARPQGFLRVHCTPPRVNHSIEFLSTTSIR